MTERRHLDVTISLVDHLNPGCGYQVRIADAITGETLLITSRDPASGADLLTLSQCLDVVRCYETREVHPGTAPVSVTADTITNEQIRHLLGDPAAQPLTLTERAWCVAALRVATGALATARRAEARERCVALWNARHGEGQSLLAEVTP